MKKLSTLLILALLVAMLPLAASAEAPVDLTKAGPPPGGTALPGTVPAGGTQAILDDFNRADGPIGGNWTVHDGSCNVVSNAATCGNMGRATFNGAPGDGNFAEIDVAVFSTALDYQGVLLNYGAGVNNIFIKVQNQSGGMQFCNAACYTGNQGPAFGLGFFSLSSCFGSAHMAVTRVGNDVTIEFTNIDGGAQPPQTYVCTGAPAPEGTGIGINGYSALDRLDNFGGPGGSEDPDIEVNPASLYAEQCADTVTQQTLQICNAGGADLTWTLTEAAFAGSMPFVPAKMSGGGVNAAISASSPAGALVTPEGSAHPEAVLWDQPLSSVNQNAYVDQEFTDYPTYSAFLADDFVNGETWDISAIYVPGDGWNGFTSLFNATSLTWQIYADDGGVPAGDPASGGAVWSLTLVPTDPQVTITTGSPGGYPSNTMLTLATPVSVPAGHWWLVFYPTAPFSGFGQFGRQPADTANGYVGQFINPGNAFGYGTDWVDWTVLGGQPPDIAFRLEGSAGPADVLPWLSEDPMAGTIPADGCVDVTVTFDSNGLAVGSYFGNLVIDSNDPDEPQVVVPVQLDVIDCNAYPDIEVTPPSLLAEQCPDTVTQQTLSICNWGAADLTWTLTEAAPKRGVTASAAPKVTLPAGAPQSLTEWLAQGKPGFQVQPVAPKLAATPETLTFYNSRAGFDADFPGLPVEGYENGSMPYGSVDSVPHPLDQYSSNAYFDPGDILPGIQFWASQTHTGDEIAVLGEQFMSNPTKGAVANYFTDVYHIMFNPPVQAAGMDLTDYVGSYSCQVDVYDEYGLVASTTSACNEAGTFLGVASDGNPIWEIVISDLAGGAEGADNIAYGGEAFDVPWLSEDPVDGTVPAGSCQDVTVTFDSTGLAAGDYYANLVIDSNDPDEPQVVVPVQLTVQECGDIVTCGNFNYQVRLDPYGRLLLRWFVLAFNQDGTPLPYVAVTADLTSPQYTVPRSVTRWSHLDGNARFPYGSRWSGTWTIDVTDMVLAGHTFVDGPQCSAETFE